jgi:hypothetical protein
VLPYRKAERHAPDHLQLPRNLQTISSVHQSYLRSRGFIPEELARVWGLQSTSPSGFYKHRIFIPVRFEGHTVSFQTLSPYEGVSPKYLGCSDEREIIPHKHMLYGFDYAVEKNRCVVVEGVTDVWRLGPGAVALFGVKWTQEQVVMICNNFDRVTVMLDADVPKAQVNRLVQTISAHGCWSVDSVELERGDPGSLSPRQAREIMKDMGF